MSKQQESSISPAQAYLYALASIVTLILLYEFRVHVGFLLLSLSVLALSSSLVLAYLAVFRPEFVRRSASQGVESYLFVRDLFGKARSKVEQSSQMPLAEASLPVEQEVQDQGLSESATGPSDAD